MKIVNAEMVVTAADERGFPRDGLPQIALAGRSNAGKSSLINALCGSKSLARTSQKPGKTQLVNFYRVNNAFYLVDLPGFGYAKVDPEKRFQMEVLLHNYVKESADLRGVLYLVDSRVPDSAVDGQALRWLLDSNRPLLVLASKADKLKKSQLRPALDAIARHHGLPEPPLPLSSLSKSGLDALWEQVELLVSG
jgi:GTP-binding protein